MLDRITRGAAMVAATAIGLGAIALVAYRIVCEVLH
jgi:hypothetical protein